MLGFEPAQRRFAFFTINIENPHARTFAGCNGDVEGARAPPSRDQIDVSRRAAQVVADRGLFAAFHAREDAHSLLREGCAIADPHRIAVLTRLAVGAQLALADGGGSASSWRRVQFVSEIAQPSLALLGRDARRPDAEARERGVIEREHAPS